MMWLVSIAAAFLCLYVVSLVLRAEPEPLKGRYAVPGRLHTLKKVLVWCLYYYRLLRARSNSTADGKRQAMGLGCRKGATRAEDGVAGGGRGLSKRSQLSLEELELVQELVCDPNAIDSVYFMGFTQTDKTFLIVRVCRKTNGLCEMWVLLRVDGVGCFQHPIHPDTIFSLDNKNSWSAGGLKLECLEPHRRWRIFFNGILRKGPYRDKWMEEEEGEFLHVKMAFIWTAFTNIFNFDTDIHPIAIAESIAQEKWSLKFLNDLQMYNERQTHYEQWGQFVGEIEIEGYERKELLLHGMRDHSYGIRDWAHMHRYVLILAHFENGLSVNLIALSIPATTTNMKIGFVMFPDGRKAGVDWMDISLPDMADDGDIADLYRISFTAENRLFNLLVSIDKSASPVMYGGLTWESRIHECVAHYRLDLTVRGWGVIEFHYRNEGGRQALDPMPSERFQEPVVSVSTRLVLPFSDKACCCAAVVGSKGAQLAQMTEMQKSFGMQFSVPTGLCVTTAALEHQMKINISLQQAVAEINDVACTRVNGNLCELCKRCVELFKSTKLALEIESAIHDQLTALKLLGTGEQLAVRSSSIGEDTEDLSAAGQLSTELGLKGFEQVCDSVLKCWASLYSFQAVQYRRQRGQAVLSSMGVVIQQMVAAQTAGVLFTCDPVTGHSGRILINSNYGLGESVVSGCADPDTITLSCNQKGQCHILKKEIGAKQQQIQLAGGGGVVVEAVQDLNSSECCMTDDVILRLGEVAFQVQKMYGTPRDIEWAIKDMQIYFLQARPITTFNTMSEFELMHEFDSSLATNYEWMTTSNIGEMLPGAVTPLTISTFGRAIEYALQEFSIKSGGISCFSPYNHKLIGICCSHFFINLMSFNCNMEQNNLITKKMMNDFVLLGRVLNELSLHDVILIYGKSPLWKRIINTIGCLNYILTAESRVNKLMKKMSTYQIQSANNAQKFYFNIDGQLPDYFEAWCISVSKSCSSGMWNAIVISILSEKTKFTSELLANVAILYSTCPDVCVADIPVLIEGITEAIRTQGKSAEFLRLDAEAAVTWLLSQESGEAGQKFQNFLQKHGFRCLREVELHEKSWRNDPKKLLLAIQANLQRINPSVKKAILSPEESIGFLKSNISWIRKIILHLVLPKARKAIAKREFLKAEAIRMNDIFKSAYYKLARLMVQEGYLPDEDLLFFLTHSEIGQILLQRSVTIITRAQCRRKILGKQMNLQFKEMNINKPQPIDQCQSGIYRTKVTLKGTTVSHGIVKGTVRVVKTMQEADCIQQGDILVTISTDIGWSPYFPLLRGLITEIGGLLSHGAVVAREYGMACIVSCKNATSLLRSGDTVILNGTKGTVQKIDEN
ncbi:rifampicin phosphotransferase-like [Narcine bancroftii]|uniref:rifampicin phosphotransferase-like n=1 Tax=Narcine bancroftii TaxID=1343680 RepID=UPI0038320BB6